MELFSSNVRPKVALLPETLKIADVPDSIYFSEEYENYISNSSLGNINPQQGGSPEKYLKGFSSDYNQSFEIGTAIHQLLLQPENFYLAEDLGKPTAKMGFLADIIYREILKGKDYLEAVKIAIVEGEYYKGSLSENNITKVAEACKSYVTKRKYITPIKNKEGIFLDKRSIETVQTCIENFNNDSNLTQFLQRDEEDFLSKMEECITVDLIVTLGKKEVPLKFKGKIDNYTLSKQTFLRVNDLKTTGNDISYFGENSFYKFHYYRQMAIYTWLIYQYYSQEYDLIIDPITMLLISTTPPFECGHYVVSNSDIQKGLKEFKELITRVAICELFGYETEILNKYIKGELDGELL